MAKMQKYKMAKMQKYKITKMLKYVMLRKCRNAATLSTHFVARNAERVEKKPELPTQKYRTIKMLKHPNIEKI